LGDAYSLPKNSSIPSEDAHFITERGIGVSDGVGGWGNYGINSAFFSNGLMKECLKLISRILS
jgi:hypothetical protein